MYNRYESTGIIYNADERYSNIFQSKKINGINQYSTFSYGNLKNFKDYGLDTILHTFEMGDKLYTISQKYYNSPEFGWLICYTNKISSELDITLGKPLTIYVPLNTLLGLING